MTPTSEPVPAPRQSARPRRVVLVASLAFSLTNFRLALIKETLRAGHEVIAIAPDHNEMVARTLDGLGVRFLRVPMARTALNPLSDLYTLFQLWCLFRELKPDVILPYTLKPVIYGCLAGRLAGVPQRFALITGLGHVFTSSNPSAVMKLVRRISIFLFRRALHGADAVFVYNQADAAQLAEAGVVRPASRITLVPGSGVDLDHFVATAPPTKPLTFLLIARLLHDKGIVEYVEAARELKREFADVRFQLLGPFDPHPSGISQTLIDEWHAEGVIEYLGATDDVRPFLSGCTVFVLPSHREGLPRTVLEAMSMGRAVITTDAPGCSDTVVDGESGFIVPVNSPVQLAGAMRKFADDPELAIRMGTNAHDLARARFDVHKINHQLLSCMGLI